MFADPSKLPTDNLYKFLSLAGLTACVLSATAYVVDELELGDRLQIAALNVKHLDASTKDLGSAVDQFVRLEKTFRDSIDAFERGTMVFARKAHDFNALTRDSSGNRRSRLAAAASVNAEQRRQTAREADVRALWAQLTAAQHNADSVRRLIDDSSASEKLESERRQIFEMRFERIYVICVLGFSIGAILTYTGFALWYTRVQRYQDSILKREAERRTHAPVGPFE